MRLKGIDTNYSAEWEGEGEGNRFLVLRYYGCIIAYTSSKGEAMQEALKHIEDCKNNLKKLDK